MKLNKLIEKVVTLHILFKESKKINIKNTRTR